MISADCFGVRETRFRRDFLCWVLVLTAVFAVTLLFNPEIDLTVSGAAKAACGEGSQLQGRRWCQVAEVGAARTFFKAIFVITALATLAWLFRVLWTQRTLIGREQVRCGFLIAVLIMGPGVVANLVLKDNWGRARPRDVIEFGGGKVFTPPLVPASECARNCSFVSGEASSIFAVFFGLAFALPGYRQRLVAIGCVAGLLAGGIRIIQGGHFFSDVLFAGVFMALTVSLLHIALIGAWREPRRSLSEMAAFFGPITRFAAGRVRL